MHRKPLQLAPFSLADSDFGVSSCWKALHEPAAPNLQAIFEGRRKKAAILDRCSCSGLLLFRMVTIH
jgi:hypothetical protein